MKKLRNTTRVQLELNERSHARLEVLKATTEATSFAEVMKNALRLYEYIIEAIIHGGAVKLHRKDGTIVELQVF